MFVWVVICVSLYHELREETKIALRTLRETDCTQVSIMLKYKPILYDVV